MLATTETKPRIMFMHMSTRGQFEFLGKWLARHGWDVTFVQGGTTYGRSVDQDGIRNCEFPTRETTIHKNDRRHILDYAAQNCYAALQLMSEMQQKEGYAPDVVMAHVGWGIGLGVKLIWPDCKYVAYHEWYYTDFNWRKNQAERPIQVAEMASNCFRNMPIAKEFDLADANWCPTNFQADRFPPNLRSMIDVISDGVDCQIHRPDPEARIDFNWVTLEKDRPVLTYATRGMEPLRGFPQFMRAIARLQAQRDDFDTIILANDSVSYGAQLPAGDSWWLRLMDELDLDHRRIHVNSMRPREEYVRTLQASTAHVYFTEPFVTSWSLTEALAMGCLVIGSNTAPVQEMVEDMENGIIVDMDDAEEVSEMMAWALDNPGPAQDIRRSAREQTLALHDGERIFPQKEAILRQMIGR